MVALQIICFQNNSYYGDGYGKRDVDDVSEWQRGGCAIVR